MRITLHPENPEQRKLNQIIQALENGAVIIYPTDTVYALGCDISRLDAVDKLCRIRKMDPSKAMLTLICKDISQIAEYTSQLENWVFKALKEYTPGPFTFILNSGSQVPKQFRNRKKTLGVRIPDNPIAVQIVEALGRPILSASLYAEADVPENNEYLQDPDRIDEEFGKIVDIFVDGGWGKIEPSTVIDASGSSLELIRQGKGEVDF